MVIILLALLVSQFLFLVLIYFANPKFFRFDFTKPLLGEQPAIAIVFASWQFQIWSFPWF